MDIETLSRISKHKVESVTLFEVAKELNVTDANSLKNGRNIIASAMELQKTVTAMKDKMEKGDKVVAERVLNKVNIALNYANKSVAAYTNAKYAEDKKNAEREKARAELKDRMAKKNDVVVKEKEVRREEVTK